MKFDVYYPTRTKDGRIRPGVKPHPLEWHTICTMCDADANKNLIDRFRNGDADAKAQLPAICYVGECMKSRANKWMRPTQAIMLDVDHVENPNKAFEAIYEKALADLGRDWWYDNCLLWHITPSGHGLRGVFWALPDVATSLEDQMKNYNSILHLSDYGDFDEPCKDFARISFFFKPDEILFENAQLLTSETKKPEGVVINYGLERKELSFLDSQSTESDSVHSEDKPSGTQREETTTSYPTFTAEEEAEIRSYDYDGTPLAHIIDRWVEVHGEPGRMKVHNYYNDLIKNFRNIMNNDKRALFLLLPRFGHTPEECWSQVESICRVNTLSKLPKEFYFFLKDNGFYKGKGTSQRLSDYMMAELPEVEKEKLPWMPPVFRELIGSAPRDFKFPMMVGLLPIMGTLSSYVQSTYWLDWTYHTTSFFSIIYAPAGTGKGFIARYMEMLFDKLRTRDFIQQAREQLFLNEVNRKGANDKAPQEPHTSLRIIEPKNSEAEFLAKQKDNHGYHMFTYAAEMDSWAKGVKAAGGNKDDMLRIAWDNGTYGQHFKSANTVKGSVKLYWNVLITGTLPQIQSYFKNVENGLVTRCSFCSIDNQEFAEAPVWKHLTPKQKEIIRRYMDRCDRNTYMEPCELLPAEVALISDAKKFDDEVDWHFTFRPRKTVDMEWLRPTIDNWLKQQLKMSARDYNKARDVFRRRCAVRGFRLGLICTTLWDNPTTSNLKKCCPFIEWFMNNDIENMMKLWGHAYNEIAQDTPNIPQKSLFQSLADEFSKEDVMTQCLRLGIKTPVRNITSQWGKFGYISAVSKGKYKKTKSHEKNADS